MSWELALMIYGVTLLGLLVFGVAIGAVMGIVGVLGVTVVSGTALWQSLGDIVWNTTNSFTLVAVPLFVLMGEIIVRTGVSGRFYAGLSYLVRGVPGALAHTNVAGCAIFAAVSGSSTATALTIGTVSLPEMRRRGYSDELSLGTLAGGGCLGILIPPSIPLVIYGSVVQESVIDLFMAGVVPGILLSLMFMGWVALRVWIRPSLVPPRAEPAGWGQIAGGLRDAVPVLLLVAALLGGMYGGIVTPTEAAGFGCLGSLLLAGFYGGLTARGLVEALRNAVVTNAVVMFVIINAQILNFALTTSGVGHEVSAWLANLGLGSFGFFVVLVAVYVLLGMFIDGISMMLLTVPLLYPTLIAYGFDGILFGVVLVTLIELGQLTPPMGLNLFAVQSISGGVGLGRIAAAAAPYAILILALCFLLFFFPQIALWLPQQMKE